MAGDSTRAIGCRSHHTVLYMAILGHSLLSAGMTFGRLYSGSVMLICVPYYSYVTVIPDYRLVPEAKFPEPIQDIRDAVAWIVKNPEELNQAEGVGADTQSIFVMGHSAGACYTATMLLCPGLLPYEVQGNIRGLILKGGAYKFPADDSSVILQLYGAPQEITDNMPITLLERAPNEVIQKLPDALFLVSEKEPGIIRAMNEEFLELFRKRTGKNVPLLIAKGHNHISPHWCLSTGKGEEWAVEVDNWMTAKGGH